MKKCDKLIPVKDNPNYMMDPRTGAVLNHDFNGMENAKIRKQKKREEKEKLERLENDVNEIKTLLTTLINQVGTK